MRIFIELQKLPSAIRQAGSGFLYSTTNYLKIILRQIGVLFSDL